MRKELLRWWGSVRPARRLRGEKNCLARLSPFAAQHFSRHERKTRRARGAYSLSMRDDARCSATHSRARSRRTVIGFVCTHSFADNASLFHAASGACFARRIRKAKLMRLARSIAAPHARNPAKDSIRNLQNIHDATNQLHFGSQLTIAGNEICEYFFSAFP